MWKCVQDGETLRIHYGSDSDCPQVAVLHLDSSYMRLCVFKKTTWGTSFIVAPSFGVNETLFQGCRVEYSYQKSDQLNLLISGLLPEVGDNYLSFKATVKLLPPHPFSTTAFVDVVTQSHSLSLSVPSNIFDTESFRPVFLSSMKVSENQWDASHFFVGTGYLQNISKDQGFFIPNSYLETVAQPHLEKFFAFSTFSMLPRKTHIAKDMKHSSRLENHKNASNFPSREVVKQSHLGNSFGLVGGKSDWQLDDPTLRR